jgi:hypothetical protein
MPEIAGLRPDNGNPTDFDKSHEAKDEPTAAISYGLSLVKYAHAQVIIYAPTVRVVLSHALISRTAAGLVVAEIDIALAM